MGVEMTDTEVLVSEVVPQAVLVSSESRVDVALKDESAGTAADWRAEAIQMLKEVKIQLRAQDEGDPAWQEFWTDVGQHDSDRLRTSANQQTMAPRGASEQVGEARMSS